MSPSSLSVVIVFVWTLALCGVSNSFVSHPMRKFSAVMALAQSTANTVYPLQNDLMIRAARGEKVERTPVWIFRQAGRHLPEYTEYKKTSGKNFLQLLDDPKDVTECTMQPIRRYNLDAAILFSDILVILQALGMEVLMPGGVGILVPTPLTCPAEVATRIPVDVNVEEKLSHVISAVKQIKEELKGKVPLIGFSAAPWTLMYYMVGGSSKKNQEVGSKWLKESPEESKALLDILTTIVIEYTSAQIKAGADMMQIFEAMGEFINEEDFYKWALPCMTRISTELRKRHPTVPLLAFPKGATYALAALQEAGYDVVTLDTQCKRSETRLILESAAAASTPPLGRTSSVQGNFDVALLKTGASTTAEIQEATKKMLAELGTQKLIANLGEGLTGLEDPALVASFIDAVHDISERMIAA
jgi:uroporphyrinogen decarboxylase